MKITRIKCWQANLQLTKPYTIAVHTIDSAENVFVYLELENGMYGVGCSAPTEFVTGETMDLSLESLEGNASELLVGRDLEDFQELIRSSEELMPETPAARAALDIALYDAFGKMAEKPLVELLGKKHEGFPTSITIGIKSLEESIAEAKENIAKGFKIIKLKTGLEVEKDIEIFSKMREAVGKHIKIRVDANQGYGVDELERFVKATQGLDVEFIEQPFPPGHLEEMLQVSPEIRQICAADEDLHDWRDAAALTSNGNYYGIFNIKLAKCGGILGGLQIADIAHSNNIGLMWGCMDESTVSITAALHVALASPATRYLDLDGSFDIAVDLATGGFILKDGWLYPNDKPGLGVELIERPF
ncbi:MAG: dipeptide epimerase [Saprospiraceae bacterium]|nr:dipeptide epimerase [Saprospiraceae bacterium]